MEEIEELLRNNNQEHILDYLEKATSKQKENLIEQIKSIDFEQLKKLYQTSKDLEKKKNLKVSMIQHVDFVDKYKMDEEWFWKLNHLGEKIIKKNQYAVVTMAGGQGTRLGHIGPKGTFLLNIEPHPTYLFQLLAEGLIKANKYYGITLNWYIMTSSENNKETTEFFKEHNYFGYPKENLKFFIQGDLPLLSEDGKLLIDENYNIKLAADGNGCIYKAMKKDGILADMKKKGIKWIFIGAVDNALLNMVDPILLGLTIDQKNQIGSKSIVKANPHEKVGVFCKKNGVPSVIEYSELPESMAEEVDEFGELLYGESHIMCNLYSYEALEKIAEKDLPYHSAHKKANYLDLNGDIIVPDKPNAYKYEAFIFDGFNYFNDISILRGARDEDFAPIKNKEGADSPQTAIDLYNAHLRRQF